MVVDQALIEEIVASAKADISQIAREAVKKQIAESITWAVRDLVNEEGRKFIKAEITPEIVAALFAEKGAIIEAVKTAAAGIGQLLAEALVKEAADNLSRGYQVGEIASKLFK